MTDAATMSLVAQKTSELLAELRAINQKLEEIHRAIAAAEKRIEVRFDEVERRIRTYGR